MIFLAIIGGVYILGVLISLPYFLFNGIRPLTVRDVWYTLLFSFVWFMCVAMAVDDWFDDFKYRNKIEPIWNTIMDYEILKKKKKEK